MEAGAENLGNVNVRQDTMAGRNIRLIAIIYTDRKFDRLVPKICQLLGRTGYYSRYLQYINTYIPSGIKHTQVAI